MKYFSWIFLFTLLLCENLPGQKTPTGLVPINDLKTAEYKGYQGGLYPNGSNSRPFKHDSLGMFFSREIKPLDASGNADTLKGKIILLSIGMSNATQEFSAFKAVADTFKSKNPKLTIVDGAVGGQTAAIISDPARNQNYWTTVDNRLQSAGVGAKQVQICWIKEADANPAQPFPVHANILQNEFEAIAKILRQRYPNCRIAYWSSRTYGGYATTALNPEPYAYESGFSVKWLIEKQIAGDTTLTCTGRNPKALWLSWGPYLWADGVTPRSDGLTWSIDDFVTSDRTHPSTTGRKKVADLLLGFFKTDLTAKSWFLKNTTSDVHSTDFSNVPEGFRLVQNYPNPFNPSTQIRFTIPGAGFVQLEVFNSIGQEVSILADRYFAAGTYYTVFDGWNLPGGIYIITLTVKDHHATRKCVLIK